MKPKKITRSLTSSNRPIPPKCNPITTEKLVKHFAINIIWILCLWLTFNGDSRREKTLIIKMKILRLLMIMFQNHNKLLWWNPLKEMSHINKQQNSWEEMRCTIMVMDKIRLTSINRMKQRTQTMKMVLKWNDF